MVEEKLTQSQAFREGRITIIEGPQRSGKTLAMSILALDEYCANKNKVITNIAYENPITKRNSIPYEPLNFFNLTMGEIGAFRNRCITIDELNFYLDSRGSMTKVNRKFCQWLLQSKKLGINTYGTTHNLGYLDLRFRENFDFLIQPQTFYEKAVDEEGNTYNKPAMLVLKWFNGPNQAHYRKTMRIDFRIRPDLLGMYNTHNTFNPFAEMEMQLEKEKLKKKTTQKKSSWHVKDLVPDYVPPSFLNKGVQS